MQTYSEGTVFVVPLRSGGYARGIVTRASKEGICLFGYFFGPRLSSLEEVEFDDLEPANAILRLRFGDLGLINGEWPIKGQIPKWNRSQWAMPDAVRKDPLGRKDPVRICYDDTDPNRRVSEYPITDAEAKGLISDSAGGYGFVEIKLTNLIN